jgi:hypothetical protein
MVTCPNLKRHFPIQTTHWEEQMQATLAIGRVSLLIDKLHGPSSRGKDGFFLRKSMESMDQDSARLAE